MNQENYVSEQTYTSPFQPWQGLTLLLSLILFFTCGFIVSGELGSIAEAGLQTVPFAILAVWAYIGVKEDWAKLVTFLWGIALVGGGAALIFLTTLSTQMVNPVPQLDEAPEFVEGSLLRLSLIVIGMGLSILLGLLGFIPAVRQGLGRILPLGPHNFVHTIALVAVVMLTAIAFVPLLILGEPPFLIAATNMAAEGVDFSGGRDNAALLRAEVYRLLWLIPAVIFAVGYGSQRNFSQALSRLGLVRLTGWQVLFGLVAAFGLVIAVFGLEMGIAQLWESLNWSRTDGEAFGLIIDFALSPIGAVVLGVTAGLGEELAVRGVLQPRLGILLSNLLFTALHALQYNWDGLLIVFTIGLVFGVMRKYTHTTLCALIHGTYDFLIIMAVVLEIPGFV